LNALFNIKVVENRITNVDSTRDYTGDTWFHCLRLNISDAVKKESLSTFD